MSDEIKVKLESVNTGRTYLRMENGMIFGQDCEGAAPVFIRMLAWPLQAVKGKQS